VPGLVIASAALGMAAAQMGNAARPFLNFFAAACDVIIKLIQWIIW
jgi:Na+/H+-dicarboxylate symporter